MEPLKTVQTTELNASYDGDVVAWANEQAHLLRTGQLDKLDLENIIEEIEDVGGRHYDQLESRMAVLMAHLIKWQYQSNKRTPSWKLTIKEQRRRANRLLNKMPSLKPSLKDDEWIADAWGDARYQAEKETGITQTVFPEKCPWTTQELLSNDFLPEPTQAIKDQVAKAKHPRTPSWKR